MYYLVKASSILGQLALRIYACRKETSKYGKTKGKVICGADTYHLWRLTVLESLQGEKGASCKRWITRQSAFECLRRSVYLYQMPCFPRAAAAAAAPGPRRSFYLLQHLMPAWSCGLRPTRLGNNTAAASIGGHHWAARGQMSCGLAQHCVRHAHMGTECCRYRLKTIEQFIHSLVVAWTLLWLHSIAQVVTSPSQ